jgi:hypothetical protein
LTPDEIRAAAEVHSELGPDYRDAVIDSFLDKVGREIDARVDARVARQSAPAPAPAPQHPHEHQHHHRNFNGSFAVPLASLIFAIPLTAIAANSHAGSLGIFIVWIGIAVVNIAYAVRRPPSPPSH